MKKIFTIVAFIPLFILFLYFSNYITDFMCLPLVVNGFKLIILNLANGFYISIFVSFACIFLLLNLLLLIKLIKYIMINSIKSQKVFSLVVLCYSAFLAGIISSYVFIITYILKINVDTLSNLNKTLDAVMFMNTVVFLCLGSGLMFEAIAICISIKLFCKRV
jgi:hypothetical protein